MGIKKPVPLALSDHLNFSPKNPPEDKLSPIEVSHPLCRGAGSTSWTLRRLHSVM